jgi:hypothetical protein
MKKRMIYSLAGLFVTAALLTLTTCSKQEEEEKTPPKVEVPKPDDSEEPEPGETYENQTVHITGGLDYWNEAILFKDKKYLFLKEDETAGNYSTLSIAVPENGNYLFLSGHFDREGMPYQISIDDYDMIIGNISDSTYDICIRHAGEEDFYLQNIGTDIDFEKFQRIETKGGEVIVVFLSQFIDFIEEALVAIKPLNKLAPIYAKIAPFLQLIDGVSMIRELDEIQSSGDYEKYIDYVEKTMDPFKAIQDFITKEVQKQEESGKDNLLGQLTVYVETFACELTTEHAAVTGYYAQITPRLFFEETVRDIINTETLKIGICYSKKTGPTVNDLSSPIGVTVPNELGAVIFRDYRFSLAGLTPATQYY